MMAEHTQGPWIVEQDFTVEGTEAAAKGRMGVPIHANGYHIGTWIDNEWDGYSPNARLIAKAPLIPELIAMLQECENYVNGMPAAPRMLTMRERIKALLAKAAD